MGESTAKANDVVIVRVGTNYPTSAMQQIMDTLSSRGIVSVVLACEDVAVVRSELPEGRPVIDPAEVTHPDDVEILRREVRAWREWKHLGGPAAWDEVEAASNATTKSGVLG